MLPTSSILSKAVHDCGSLLGVTLGADLEMDVRIGDAQLAEKDLRHGDVVVLSGVDQKGLQRVIALLPPRELLHERSDLHEVRPRPGHEEDLHSVVLIRASTKRKSVSSTNLHEMPRMKNLLRLSRKENVFARAAS